MKQLEALRSVGRRASISDLVVCETYFALQYHYEVPKQLALNKLRVFLESPEIAATGDSFSVLQTPALGRAKPGFVDRVIHAQYLREDAAMLTFEKSAAKLPRAVVIERSHGAS